MAVELCSESAGTSPRISFSHDLCIHDIVPVEQRPLRSQSHGLNSNSSFDFDVSFKKSFDQELYSSADELFSDGKIRPAEIKKKNLPRFSPTAQFCRENGVEIGKSKKGTKVIAKDDAEDPKQNSKSFWKFKRSSSVNCGSVYGRGGLCPLPLLSRSNSTGSVPKQSSQKHSISGQKTASSVNYQKPPLKKGYGPLGNGSVHVNPVLNVSSGNLFGLGSFLFNGKDKSKKK